MFRVFAGAFYAPYVEWGTRRMTPRLFLTHAVMAHETELGAAVSQAMSQAFTDVFGIGF